jgi:hypothetical protein
VDSRSRDKNHALVNPLEVVFAIDLIPTPRTPQQ